MSKRQKKRVTLEDIARKAAVSTMTVSRVLNNKGEISESTRQRVLKIIEELDYRPSRIARSLATNRSYTVGVTIPDIANPYFAELVSAAQTVAWENDYNVILCNTQENHDRERDVLRLLEENRVDGVIIGATRLPDEDLLELLKKQRAVILINRDISLEGIGIVQVDELVGASKAVNHLLSKHRHLGMLAGPPYSQSSRLRLQAYQDIQSKQGYDDNLKRVEHCSPDATGGYQATIQILTNFPEIEGLFCYNDLVAIGALQACLELNKKVPDDLAIVGYDDTYLASHVFPPLTTVHSHIKQIGKIAMEKLLQHIQGKSDNKKVVIEPQLIIRESAP